MTFALWGMKSKRKTYGMSGFCKWEMSKLSYDGLCSHNPLFEPVKGTNDLGLSATQREEMEREAKERKLEWQREYDTPRNRREAQRIRR